MIAGHYGVAFAIKGWKRPSWTLTTLIAAAWLSDYMAFALVLAGVERQTLNPTFTKAFPYEIVYGPYSHGLAGAIATSAVVAVLAWKRGHRDSLLLGLVVLSHYFCDLLVHGPDLAVLAGSGPKIGFALWNWPLIADLLECGMLAGGLILYLNSTRASTATGRAGILVVAAIAAAITVALPALPPPPTAKVLAVGSLAALLGTLPVIGWLERQRRPTIERRFAFKHMLS